MTAFDLQKFELEFRQLRKELPMIHDEEVHRHLLKRLPSHMVNWVADEEARLKTERPRVVWTVPEDRTNADICQSVLDFIGEMPERVHRVQPKVFVVTFGNMHAATKFLELNGMQIGDTGTTMQVRPANQQMGLDQVFTFLTGRLECRDKADSYLRTVPNQNGRWRTPNRDPRYVRITDAEEESTESEGSETEVQPRRYRKDRRYRKNRSLSPVNVAGGQKNSNTAPHRPSQPDPLPPLLRSHHLRVRVMVLRLMGERPSGRLEGRTWDKSKVVCYRCNRPGHYAFECYTNLDGQNSNGAKGKGKGRGRGKGQNNGQNGQNGGRGRGKGNGRPWRNNGGGGGQGNAPPPQNATNPQGGNAPPATV